MNCCFDGDLPSNVAWTFTSVYVFRLLRSLDGRWIRRILVWHDWFWFEDEGAEVESLAWRNNVRACSLDNLSHSFAVQSTFALSRISHWGHSLDAADAWISLGFDLEGSGGHLGFDRFENFEHIRELSTHDKNGWLWLISGKPGCYK